jgi:D-beta-D-heptose 7-phosphate kinase/D-beta-D-heptose 1-phosphate adenosyltransferase
VIEAFHRLEAAAPTAQVVCLGDVIVDRYVQGTVGRISPEAPIPVLAIEREYCSAGGAANVAANAAALGCPVVLLGVTGQDHAAEQLQQALSRHAALDARLLACANRPTTVKTRFVAGGHQLLRADSETCVAVSEDATRAILASLQTLLRPGGVLVISDYLKGVAQPALCEHAIALARARGCAVVVDPKGRDFGKYRGADVLTPNVNELSLAAGEALHGSEAIVAAARALAKAHAIGHVLATRSQDGMSLVAASGTAALHIPSQAREVFDVSGAGDTVVAALASALGCGVALEEAARLANAAAGVAVSKRGTATVSLAELGQAAGQAQAAAVKTRYGDRAALAAQVRDWQAAGLQVGFTNGCFDLLHAGHLHSLQTARSHCDRLVVAVNSDASVRGLKGPTRPVQDEATRAEVIGQLRCCDAVIVFGEETPQALIETLAPNVLFKGRDYEGRTVAGADFVRARGGQVVLIDLVPGASTTATIGRLLSA